MEPSWTFPIPQAMQQHRGTQIQRAAPAKGPPAGTHADTAMARASESPRAAAHSDDREPRLS